MPARGQSKVHKVMSEYKHGTLKSSSGAKVKSRDQAIAIAMSEAGMAKGKRMKSYGSLTLPAGCNVGEKRMMEAMKVGAQKFKPMGVVKMGGASPKGAKGGY